MINPDTLLIGIGYWKPYSVPQNIDRLNLNKKSRFDMQKNIKTRAILVSQMMSGLVIALKTNQESIWKYWPLVLLMPTVSTKFFRDFICSAVFT